MTPPIPPAHFAAIAEREKGLHRGLSTGQLSMIAIGGAIGTGLFLGSSFAIGFAGPAVLISYSIGALITLLLMGCLAEMTVAHPTSGSFGAWAEFYLSPLAGFLVRYAYWAAIVFALGTEVSAVAIYMQFWFPSVPGWLWILGFSLALILINTANVSLFGSVEYAFSAFKLLAIVLFLLLGSIVLLRAPANSGTGLANFTHYGGFFPNGFSGAWIAVLVALFSFFSVEMVAVAAGEAQDPRRAIVQAFKATFLRLVLFYLLTLAVILALLPWSQTQALSGVAQSPFVSVLTRTHLAAGAFAIHRAAAIVNLVLLIAALSAMNSQLYITSRMLFSLSRSGFAPRIFGLLTRTGVPVPALLLSTAGIGLAALLNALYHDDAFSILLAVSIFGAMFVWLMIFITHLSFRRRHRAETLAFRLWGYPWTTLLGAALMLALLLTTPFVAAFRATLYYGIPFLLLLLLGYYLRTLTMTRKPS
jgi:AAT family amino acid transporter